MVWRLGLDVGTNSLGWAAVELDADTLKPKGFLKAGSRIFGAGIAGAGRDPKSGASLAVDRRAARAMRRGRDRFKQRQAALLKYLQADGFFPSDPEARRALANKDPYALRARALDEELSLPEIGRAIFHLNQRRGFQSNRKADRKDDEAGKVAIGIDRLQDRIEEAGARTFGEFLHLRRESAENRNAIPSVRTRLRPETGEGAKGDGYDFYPGRALIQAEFEAIWHAQAPHHPDTMTQAVHDCLYEIVFWQRPLKTPAVGRCSLPPYAEERLPKAHPLFQRRRLLEEVNALMIVRPGEAAVRLTPEQRDTLYRRLKDKPKVSFEKLRKDLKLDPAARFNKESEHRTELKGDEVAAVMQSKQRFGTRWLHLSLDQQWDVIARQQAVESDADDAAFRAWLEAVHALTPEQAKAVARAPLPAGYGRFGLTATTKLVAALADGRTPEGRTPDAAPIEPDRVVVYSEAVVIAGYGHHSDHRTGEIFTDAAGRPALPYYAIPLERHVMPGTADPREADDAVRHGRLTNPTVHIALGQLRQVVNRLIRAYGPPHEIAVELARELKLSDDDKKQRNLENTRNRQDAEKRSEKLREIGQRDTGANRALLKLWEELNPGNVLDRRCVYTGTQISIDMLFSNDVEVDHILPFTATLDDSNGNKIVCMRSANRDKRKRSPYDAWGHTPLWPEIAERAARLPRNKRWRFEPDAMERFEKEGGFLARQLIDTQYLGRLARDYLSSLYPVRGEDSGRVWVSPGRLTEMVRRKLGLNDLLGDHNLGADQPKNRKDHRHHAIDAVVVAILDRAMLQRIAYESGQGATDADMLRILVPTPWEGFRDDLKRTVDAIVVAHRPDHGTVSKAGLPKGGDKTAGRLHNDTAYGLTGATDAKGTDLVVHRIPIGSLKKAADIERVRDPLLRDALSAFTAGFSGKDFERRIGQFPELGPLDYRGIRRVRIIEPLTVIPIRDAAGRAYKGYKGDSNYRYDVWEMPDGKWRATVVSMFDAHQPGERPRPHPAARKVLSLQRDDMLAIDRGSGRELVRVVKFSDKQFAVAAPNEGGALKARDADGDDPFKYSYPSPNTLKAWQARQVRVDQIGRVLDPGFPARKTVRPTRKAAE